MCIHKPIQTRRGNAPIRQRCKQLRRERIDGMALAALALLALATPRAVSGFLAQLSFDVELIPYTVAVGDLNADGIPDLVVANNVSNNVSVLLGNGDGTFRPAVNNDVSILFIDGKWDPKETGQPNRRPPTRDGVAVELPHAHRMPAPVPT